MSFLDTTLLKVDPFESDPQVVAWVNRKCKSWGRDELLKEMSNYPSFTPKKSGMQGMKRETEPSLIDCSPIPKVTIGPSACCIAVTPCASNVASHELPSPIPFRSLDEEGSAWSQIQSQLFLTVLILI